MQLKEYSVDSGVARGGAPPWRQAWGAPK